MECVISQEQTPSDQTDKKTGNLYKLKRIHFQKNKLLRGEEGPFLNKYVIQLT